MQVIGFEKKKFNSIVLLAVALATALSLSVARDAAASGTPADLKRYCRDKHPNSIFQIQQTRWGPKHVCRQPGATGGFVEQGIDLDEACRLTNGSTKHHKHGRVVHCSRNTAGPTRPGPGRAAVRKPANLARYCRTKYPNSQLRIQHARGGPRFLCRVPGATGGFVNQPINLAEACRMTNGSTRYRKEGIAVWCGGSVASVPRGRPGALPANKTLQAVWRRNRRRIATYCTPDGRMTRRPSRAAQEALRRDNVTLCRVLPARERSGSFCRSMYNGTHCRIFAPKRASTRCLCKLVAGRMLP